MTTQTGFLMRNSFLVITMLLSIAGFSAEPILVRGLTRCGDSPVAGVEIKLVGEDKIELLSAEDGSFEGRIRAGNYTLFAFAQGYNALMKDIEVYGVTELDIELSLLGDELGTATVVAKHRTSDMGFLRPIEGTAIYSGMKSEVISPERSMANTAMNNPRQTFAKVAGLNVWENDGAGIQLGIGTRGLSPNRTSNFNVRQNLYDISADALGYPESYYTPPLEAVEKIEIVRGAASLQYGTQFGGLLNFKLKEGTEEKKFEVLFRQTVGTYGIENSINSSLANRASFLSMGGTWGKVRYYGFLNLKDGMGWRPNSDYNVKTGHFNLSWQATKRMTVGGEFTAMSYLAHQPGGLIDSHFEQDPRQSFRERNWFKVDWNLASVKLNYRFSDLTELSSNTFGVLASRQALGFLGNAGRVDHMGPRDLLFGEFKNVGNETRILHRISHDDRVSVLAAGIRIYSGYSIARQGLGDDGYGPSFGFTDEDPLFFSDYAFPNFNFAAFTQEVISLSDNISITPGVRYEHIATRSSGTVDESILNAAGDVVETVTFSDNRNRDRGFVLGGIGMSWKPSERCEAYSNFSQNYRAINFTDIQLRNMGLMIDPDIQDEKGFNADFGVRGTKGLFRFDASFFMLKYNDRIGSYYTSIPDPILIQKPVRYRTNISDARNLGVEALVEIELAQRLNLDKVRSLKIFANSSYIDAQYTSSEVTAFEGKRVELVPQWTARSGVHAEIGAFGFSSQYSFTGQQFSDATNAIQTPNGVEGIIPAYSVVDMSASYARKYLKLELNVNNLMNTAYFTRRAAGYPGPGILPSDGRAIYLTAQVKF